MKLQYEYLIWYNEAMEMAHYELTIINIIIIKFHLIKFLHNLSPKQIDGALFITIHQQVIQ